MEGTARRFGHVLRRDRVDMMGRRMLRMELCSAP